MAEIPSADIVAPIIADEQVNGIAPFGQGLPSYMEHGAWSMEHGAWSSHCVVMLLLAVHCAVTLM